VLAGTLVEEPGENKYCFGMRVSLVAMAGVRPALVRKVAAAAITAAASSAGVYDL
jgi:hypothetical protein